uniref:protein lin-37 homolog n=1 Tax=Lonchura striata TaxID=40157 RepID=UPI000B4CBF51|nr:protein lin-37 homolog [Lonchura striata domestica]
MAPPRGPRDASGAAMAAKVKVEKPGSRWRRSRERDPERPRPRRPRPAPPGRDSFVIRLFDRSVELGQFPAGTPLYPVCRAWIGHSPAPAPAPEQVRPYRSIQVHTGL